MAVPTRDLDPVSSIRFYNYNNNYFYLYIDLG